MSVPGLQRLPPLDTPPLFPPLHRELIALLRSLRPDDWSRPTVAGAWCVRDVAAHLLDGELRALAAHRDGHVLSPDALVESYADVVALIQRLNAGGVQFGARLSTRLLVELLEITGGWMSEFVASLDPDAPALFPVAWAGETASDNRFDTAREYTERWHHQMQIRDALGERGHAERLLAEPFLAPLLETSLRVLPHAYRGTEAPVGTTVTVQVTGEHVPGLSWTLRRDERGWELFRGSVGAPTAFVATRSDTLWRLLFNALPDERARRELSVAGDEALVAPLRRARSVMV